jgi:predicted ATP-grasp superfamily ATP-dependent carboligase
MQLPVKVVVTGHSANALGVLRALCKFNLTLLCDSDKAPAWFSRFGAKVLVADTKSAQIVDDLVELGKSFAGEKAVLIPTEEKTVVQISAAREKLQPYYYLELCPHSMMLALQSKQGFADLAVKAGSPVPASIVIRSKEDLKALNQLSYPCVFKPLEQNENYSKKFKKAYKVQSSDEVISLYENIEPVLSDMIVQEWLEGEDSDIYFCLAFYDEHSNCVSCFTGRKLRSWPLNVGGTAACTSAPEAAAELQKLTDNFVQSIGYQGLMGMEYKYDRLRKGFYMIEPTVGRTDYQHEVASLSGSNFLEAMVCYFAGIPGPKARLNRSVMWFDEIADANAKAHGASRQFDASLTPVAAIWRWSDPRPGLVAFWRRLQRKLK